MTTHIESESDSWSTDRASEVGPIDLAVRLWACARDLHEQGELARARDAALDATAVWAIDRSSLEEEVILELLSDLWGDAAAAIMRSARQSSALSAWKVGTPISSCSVAAEEPAGA